MAMTDDELQAHIDKVFAKAGAKFHKAAPRQRKRWYCPKCEKHVFVPTSFGVPRHECGRQMRPAWKEK